MLLPVFSPMQDFVRSSPEAKVLTADSVSTLPTSPFPIGCADLAYHLLNRSSLRESPKSAHHKPFLAHFIS